MENIQPTSESKNESENSRMAEETRRVTRSQFLSKEDAESRQVLNVKIDSNDITLRAATDIDSCRLPVDRRSRHSSNSKIDAFDVISVSNTCLLYTSPSPRD